MGKVVSLSDIKPSNLKVYIDRLYLVNKNIHHTLIWKIEHIYNFYILCKNKSIPKNKFKSP